MSRFSFIIPVYNCGKYLPECVRNIEKISLQNYEILLIDDGSTDGTNAICDELACQNENIRCCHQKNQGVSVARNRGLELSTGDYVIFLDADDSIDPDKIYDLLKIVDSDQSIDMVIFGMSFDYYYKGHQYRSDQLGASLFGKLESSVWIEYIPELFAQNMISPIWNKVIKRSILEENQLKFREDMFLYEDLEFSLRCMACCNVICFSPEIIYHYRQAEDEGNAARRLQRIEHISMLIDKIESALNELIKKQNVEASKEQIKKILADLYLVLAREKISISSREEIHIICDDFAAWLDKSGIRIQEEQRTFVDCLLNRKVFYLIFKRDYIAVRHRIAVRVKNMKWYQKRKSGGRIW